MSKLDILDTDGNKTGEVMDFVEAHKMGKWHAHAHVWVFNSKGEVLLQKRAANVSCGGKWDISAAGHLSQGDKPQQAALRELVEEIGINAKRKELKKIKVLIQSRDSNDFKNREFNHIYLFRFDGNPNGLKVDEHEVSALKFISLDEFEKEINDPLLYEKYVPYGDYYKFIIDAIRKELNKLYGDAGI